MKNSDQVTFVATSSKWVSMLSPNSQASIRLFCFPYAGAGIAAFAAWSTGLPAEVEVAIVQLPGREQRVAERSFTCLDKLIPVLADNLAAHFGRPFAFFGHSLGALIAFELTRELRRRGMAAPSHLFVSGHRAPHLPDRTRPLHKLPEGELVRELKRLNGTPEMVFKYPELWQLARPVLQADFEMCETYLYRPEAQLKMPITALGGDTDPRVSVAEIAAWKEHTNSSYSLQLFHGDHFYLHHSRKDLLALIGRQLLQRGERGEPRNE